MAITNTIYIGSLTEPLYSFNNERIRSISTEQSVALVGQELSIDTLSFTVSDAISNVKDILVFRSSDDKEIKLIDGEIYAIDIPNSVHVSDLILLPSGTPVWYYQNDDLVGKFYLENVLRTGSNVYDVNCVSTIGILEKLETGGGLYQATTFGDVLGKILAKNLDGTGDPVIEYVVDDDVAELQVSGWIPHGSKRDALYQLIFAFGVNIVKNPDGRPRFTFVYTNGYTTYDGWVHDYSSEIVDDDIFDVGNIEYTPTYSSVTVLEHTYTPLLNGNTTVLYDNSGSATGPVTQVWFDNAPIMVSTLTTEGGIYIESANENGAVVSGIGKISGVPYTHATRSVSKANVGGDIEKTITVNDATMVSDINSENLLKRLYAFYCPEHYIEKISNDVVYGDQRTGKQYRFHNPYMEKSRAFLSKMSINASSFNRASCEYYADYAPAGQEGLYQHCQILKRREDVDIQDWYPPALEEYGVVTQARIVLISGGTGGGSGWPGENGEELGSGTTIGTTDNYSECKWYGGKGGAGGAGGAGGSPGKVKVVTINNLDQDKIYSCSIGKGGEGGARTGFIPDTRDQLRQALQATEPSEQALDSYYAEELSRTDWAGAPNAGSAGTATVFYDQGGIVYSTDDEDAFVPEGGVYNPLWDEYYALPGNPGVKGGDGGARKEGTEENFAWATDGESVSFSGVRYLGEVFEKDDPDLPSTWYNGAYVRKFESFSESYQGGLTGQTNQNFISGLPECPCIAYGGSGAGAAVGLSREINPHMDGQSDASGSWYVSQDEGGGG